MPLKLTVDTLDDIPEALHDAYEEKDGKFVLNVEGMEDTSGLKSALEKERKAARELEKRVKRWESLGKSDEEIAEMLRAQEEAENKKAEEEGDFQKILKQHQERFEKDKKELMAELEAARTSERNAVIGNSLMSALSKAGATDEGVDLLPERLAARIKYETQDGKRVLRIMAADGETPMAGASKDGTATFDDLVKEAADKWPSLFKGSGAGGSGMQPQKGSGGAGHKKKSDFKTEKERAAFVDEHGLDKYNSLPA